MSQLPFRRNFLQHALAVSAWMQAHDARGGVDPRTLGMEIAVGDRAVRFYPQFSVEQDGQVGFVPRLATGVSGFVGWLPRPGRGWLEAGDKLAFKSFARKHGLRTPLSGGPGTLPACDYLVKKADSTLGRHLHGPFPASQRVDIAPGYFWEQFVRGQVVKAWYWNGELAVVERLAMPTVTGDGRRSVAELALRALGPAAAAIAGTSLEDQLVLAGRTCLQAVREEAREDIAFSLDGVLDDQGRVWFLEVNCNPQLHPAFYAPMLNALFVPVAQEA